ncbi:hypothetical protein BH09PSE5_BH09PSE5_00980 [soil metagenome]
MVKRTAVATATDVQQEMTVGTCPPSCNPVSWTHLVDAKSQIAGLLDDLRAVLARPDANCADVAKAFQRLQHMAAYGSAVALRCSGQPPAAGRG